MIATATSDVFAVHSMCSDAGITAGFQFHLNAARLAVEDVNMHGGILGRHVEIIDHSSDDVTSVTLADGLHAQGSDYLIGPNGSSLVLRNLGVTTPRQMIQAGYNNAGILGDGRRYPYYFQPHFTGEQQAVVFLAYAAELGARRVGVLYERSIFGESALAAHRSLSEAAGIEVVAAAVSSTAASHLRPISSLRRSGAEVLVLLVTPSPAVRMVLTSLASTGWGPPVLGQSALFNPDLYRDLPASIARSCFSTAFRKLCVGAGRDVGERQRDYAARLAGTLSESGHMGVMAHVSSPYYDWLRLLKQAIEEAGDFGTSGVRRVLEDTRDYDGMISDFSFTPDCHTGVGVGDLTLASAGSLRDGTDRGGFPQEVDGMAQAMELFRSRTEGVARAAT